MTQDNPKLLSKTGILVDLVLTVIFFLYMAKVCGDWSHSPGQTPEIRMMVGAFCALPITGVFWLALGLFRVTYVDEKQRKKAHKQGLAD